MEHLKRRVQKSCSSNWETPFVRDDVSAKVVEVWQNSKQTYKISSQKTVLRCRKD